MSKAMLPTLVSAVLGATLATVPLGAGDSHAKGSSHHSSHHRREPRVACSVVDIVSESRPRRRHDFRATRILALQFETQLVGYVKQERALRLRLYTPQGFLYQVLEVPVEHAGRKRRRLEARLPVAGTSIMASGLYGRWKIVPYLDEDREPCGASRRFVIKP